MDLQQPDKNTYKTTTIVQILVSWLTVLLTGPTVLWLKLYKNSPSVSPATGIGDLVECDFGGYAKVVVAAFSAVNQDGGGTAYALTPLVLFQCNGVTGNTVNGAYLSMSNGTTATATNAGSAGNYSGAFVITAAGTGYQVAPAITLNGATGSGALAHAVILGGTVIDIVLDNPGNGLYTTFTVVIAPPEQLLVTAPFANPVGVALATDAIPYVQELAIQPFDQ